MSDRRLDEALAALADDDAADGASPEIAERLRAEVRGLRRTIRLRQYAIGAAAAVLLLAALLTSRVRPPVPTPTETPTNEVATAFFPLTYSDVPITDAQIVRMEVPRASLMAFGLEPPEAAPSQSTVLADVVVGEDGLARAVRFVRATNQ
jgi:hypothetical protein